MTPAVVTPTMAATSAIAPIAIRSDIITIAPAAVTDAIGFVIISPVTVPAAISPAITNPFHCTACRGQDKQAESDSRP
jgi:hypothetical protein